MQTKICSDFSGYSRDDLTAYIRFCSTAKEVLSNHWWKKINERIEEAKYILDVNLQCHEGGQLAYVD